MLTWLILVFAIIYRVDPSPPGNETICNGHQANYNLKNMIGTWWVVAIIPGKLFSDDKQITCYKAEFSETDEAGLRWLMNKTLNAPQKLPLEDSLKGTVIRQRYHTENSFDVWSKSVEGVNGCFKQVISLNIKNNDIHNTTNNEAMMQLHFIESIDGSGPFMVQMLWGKLVSAVIYRRKQGITQDQLKPVFEYMSKLRGPQRLPKTCENTFGNIFL